MKIWFDTEFIEDGKTIELISIGMVREDGKTYYAENSECDLNRACPWVKEYVIPHLKRTVDVMKTRNTIKQDILDFVGPNPEFWAYYAYYDWIVMCQLFGRMVDLPMNWPMFCLDIKQLWFHLGKPVIPYFETGVEHNALDDALRNKKTYEWLMNRADK